jgi:hypothetical protein
MEKNMQKKENAPDEAAKPDDAAAKPDDAAAKPNDAEEKPDAAAKKDAAEAQLNMLKLMEKKSKKILISSEPVIEKTPKESSKLNIMLFTLTLEYGSQYNPDIDKLGLATVTMGHESKSNLIHPVLKIYSTLMEKYIDIIHFDEDLFANFNHDIKYRNRLEKIIKSYLIV